MAKSRIVVDGSNIATEGRTFPSLAQLESALAELRKEHPKAEITVVVDATFAHRIDPSELHRFETATAKGEYITPPAGAIGRGDAFILLIAEKANAVVLSNDSFQEFHGDHAWLFDSDRILGASPVPGVGWIFIPRTPVRGAKSRAAVRGVRNLPPMPTPKTPPPARAKKVATTEAVVEKKPSARERPARHVATSVAAVNDPTTFITFIASHPLGAQIEAEVESFTSHGAIIRYQGVQCYAPLSGLGSPPPRSPRDVLSRGEVRTFVVRGLDPERRGIELALPGVDAVAPSAERTVKLDDSTESLENESAPRMRPTKRTGVKKAAAASAKNPQPSKDGVPPKRAGVKKVAATKSVDFTDVPAHKVPRKNPAKKLLPQQGAAPGELARVVDGAKVAVKKLAAKRTAALKSTGPVSTNQKSTAQKSTGRKTTGQKTNAQKTTTQKTSAQKTSAQKTSAQKTTVSKRSVQKMVPKKTTAQDGAPHKSPAKRGETKTRRS